MLTMYYGVRSKDGKDLIRIVISANLSLLLSCKELDKTDLFYKNVSLAIDKD